MPYYSHHAPCFRVSPLTPVTRLEQGGLHRSLRQCPQLRKTLFHSSREVMLRYKTATGELLKVYPHCTTSACCTSTPFFVLESGVGLQHFVCQKSQVPHQPKWYLAQVCHQQPEKNHLNSPQLSRQCWVGRCVSLLSTPASGGVWSICITAGWWTITTDWQLLSICPQGW